MVFKQIMQRNKRNDSAIPEASISLGFQRETLNSYEEIDDMILISHDTDINEDEENSDTSRNSEQRGHNNLNNDYLNPYQQIIPTSDNYLYITMETSADINTTDQNIAAEDQFS